jgi:hypothetical protein
MSGLALAGCSSNPPDEDVSAVTRELQRSWRAGDLERVCDRMTANAIEMAGYSGHRQPTTCERALRPFLKAAGHDEDPQSEPDGPRVVDAKVDDGRTTVKVRASDGSTADATFVADDGRWKLDSMFNATLSVVQNPKAGKPDGVVPAPNPPPLPPRTGEPVEVWSRGKAPCPPVDGGDPRDVVGGCTVSAFGARGTLSVLGPLGVQPFVDCGISYTLHVDSLGRGWVDTFGFVGSSRCTEARACWLSRGSDGLENAPWRARIVRDAHGLALVMGACLDTCIGRFEGDVRFDMRPTPHGWRLRADSAALGASGWRIDGEHRLRGAGFSVREPDRS